MDTKRRRGWRIIGSATRVGSTLVMLAGLFAALHFIVPSAKQERPRLDLARLEGGTTLALRQDSPLPNCHSDIVIRGIMGQLTRVGTAHVNGLTDIQDTTAGKGQAQSCQAMANLDFGTQQVDYTINRLPERGTAWELVVTVPE